MKYYFSIEGITMDLNTEDEANDVCVNLQRYLNAIGIKEANVFFSDEEFYKDDHGIA